MPSMWNTGQREPRYERLRQDVELRPADMADGQGTSLFSDSETESHSYTSSSMSAQPCDTEPDYLEAHIGDGLLTPCKRAGHDGRNVTTCLVTSSLLVILIVASLSLGLGGYSVFIFKPSLVIDKSVDAFSIPNHKASRGYHALQEAKSEYLQPYSHHVSKRSIRHLTASELNSPINADQNVQEKQNSGAKTPGDTFFEKHFNHLEQKDDDGLSMGDFLHRIIKRSLAISPSWKICLSPQQCPRWKLQVIFLAVGEEDSGNMFTAERLKAAHNVEKQIINHPRYVDFCWKDPHAPGRDFKSVDPYKGCAPLNSLLTYFYPSVLSSGEIRYDGRGSNMVDLKSALNMAMSHKEFYYFVDENVNSTIHKSRLLRTEVVFGTPLKGFHNSMDHKSEQGQAFKKFVVSYINMLASASSSKVKVLYGGNELFDYEVETTFWSDLWLARFALIFIGLFIFILSSFSLWLTVWGLIAIGLSFPMAIFLYRVAFNIQALGILNGAAAFVVIGIGVDDVFVFVNTFRQAEHMDKIKGRLFYTIKTAGKATFFTSFTTAAAFAANIASVIPALHEFGLFMALIVACCWISVILLLPPVLYLWYILFAWLEGLFFGSLKYLFYKIVLRKDINTLQVYYRSGSDEVLTETGGTGLSSSHDDDDDVPILQMENNEEMTSSVQDEPLLVPYISSSDPSFGSLSSSTQSKNKGKQLFDVGHKLQQVLCRFITGPVIKACWVVAVVYFIVLVVSVGLMTQIQTSSKPPQLFKDDTNLQMVLDLKANLSIDKFSCPRCSGVYNHNSDSSSNNPPKHIPPNTSFPPGGIPPGGIPPWHIPPVTANPYPFTPAKKTHKTFPTKGHNPYQHMTTPMPELPDKKKSHFPVLSTVPHKQLPTAPPMTNPQWPIHHISVSSSTTAPTTTNVHVTPSRAGSLPAGFNVCKGDNCGKAEKRPVMEAGAIVYVVFGIKDLDRANLTSDHVINDDYGTVVYDQKFADHFTSVNMGLAEDVKELCIVCKKIAANTDLVINGSAQCLPSLMEGLIDRYLKQYKECENLPRDLRLYSQRAPGHAEARPSEDRRSIKWMAFAFESTTSKGQSYFKAYDEYLKWEKFINTVKADLRKDSPLQTIYQTSQFWTKVLMEVVCVSSAIYGVVLSVIICVITVAVFTGHILLLLIVLLTIGGIICLVVALFYVAGWEMGAVEAVSLSILVGSSVDYCVHVVEGYLLAGESPQLAAIESSSKQRQWRVKQAIQHIGVSIVSSALTTVVAAIPLTQTTIRPFSRFGDIVAMNTTFAIVYALTACSAFLALFGPARFRWSWRSCGISVLITLACTAVAVLTLFILSRVGVNIPSPNGDALFPK